LINKAFKEYSILITNAKGSHDMSRHLNLLRAIFQEPVSANIHWREVESLLHHLGAVIEPTHGARFRVVLNQVEFILHHPHHGSECTKQDLKQLREHLTQAGISPSLYEADKNQP
jgi:HicA toxin of bacterial toxin-antitoxin,